MIENTREPVMSNDYYVEVVDLNGIAHHVGPFKEHSKARDWIARNSLDSNRRQLPTPSPGRSAAPSDLKLPEGD
jgi:hypothetical protein